MVSAGLNSRLWPSPDAPRISPSEMPLVPACFLVETRLESVQQQHKIVTCTYFRSLQRDVLSVLLRGRMRFGIAGHASAGC